MAFPFPCREERMRPGEPKGNLPNACPFLACMTGKTLPKAVYRFVSNAIRLVCGINCVLCGGGRGMQGGITTMKRV